MKLLSSIILLLVLACPLLQAATDWQPRVSLAEPWRWAEIDSLAPYEIIFAAKGPDNTVWCVHQGGLIAYNGHGIREFPIPELLPVPIIDVFAAANGSVIISSNAAYWIWRPEGAYKVAIPQGQQAIRNGIIETPTGEIIAATSSGLYRLKEARLQPIEIPLEAVTSLLIDNKGLLWISERGDRPIQVIALNLVHERYYAVVQHRFPSSGKNAIGPWLFMDSFGRVLVVDPDEEDQCFYYENYVRKPAFAGLRANSLLSESFDAIETKPGEVWFCTNRNLVRWTGADLEVFQIEDYPIPPAYPFMLALGEEQIFIGGRKLVPRLIDLSTRRWTTFKGLNFQAEDAEGGLWFLAESREIVRLKYGEWTVHRSADGVIDTPNRILSGSDQSVWASGAHQGQAAVAHLKDGIWTSYTFPQVAKTFSHLAALETSEGHLIFGGGTPVNELSGAMGGAVIFERTANGYQGTHYPPPAFSGRTAKIVERSGDGLLFSVASVFRANEANNYLNVTGSVFRTLWIDDMIVDRQNNLWVASIGEGLHQHDGNEWIYHGATKGLNTKNTLFLLEDRLRDRILALTGDGLFHFDGVSWSRWGPDFDMRFIRENHTLFQTDDGAIWVNFTSRSWLLEQKPFGQHQYEFQTIRYMPESMPPQTTAHVSAERFPEGSQIQITFQAADFWNQTPTAELVYSWRLNGGDWTPFHQQAMVTLDALKAGSYHVSVRSRDRDGNVDGSPSGVQFAVIAPLWKQAWFMVLMIAGLLLIVFLLYTLYKIRIKAALALDEFKLDFFTNISHELRNPLAVIISPAESLLESVDQPFMRKKLEMILRNARKMQGMVDQLLDFRKIEKKRWRLQPEGGEIMGFTADAIKEHEPRWLANEQRLQMALEPDSCLCSFDQGVLLKIINNLISNAIKYSGNGKRIDVRSYITEAADSLQYTLVVEDQGPGIPLHEQSNVLQPFYRVRRETTVEGSGVGLAMVNQLVSLWGGSLRIDSPLKADGNGTRFTVKLPLEPYREPAPEHLEEATPEPDHPVQATLLVVDDNEDIRSVLIDAFQAAYRVIEADDGISGFDAASEQNPDLVISDVMMPGMNGYQLCEKLKNDPETSHIPVILLTARSSVEHRIEGIKAGADAYIPKPLDVHHLKARVENLLETRRELKMKFARQLVIEATEITVTPTDELILKKAIKIVEDHMMDEVFGVEKFGELMGMSRSTLNRKIKAVTGLSPLVFVQNLRLKRAAQLLTTSDLSVSEIAARVGFYDLSYFGKLFKREFGVPPTTYAGR